MKLYLWEFNKYVIMFSVIVGSSCTSIQQGISLSNQRKAIKWQVAEFSAKNDY